MLSGNNGPGTNLLGGFSGNLPPIHRRGGHILTHQLHQFLAFGELPEAKRLLCAIMNDLSVGHTERIAIDLQLPGRQVQ